MREIKVLRIFNTSLGVVAILEFPSGIVPQINLELQGRNGNYRLKGTAFEKPKEFIDFNAYACIVDAIGENLEEGEVLQLI